MPGFSLASRLDGAIGGKTATAFDKAFGVKTVGELLEHYPRRYARRGELTPIDSLPLGEPVTIVAEVVSANERRMQNRRGSLLEVVISDGDGRMSLTFFNQPWRLKDLTPGRRGIFSGKVGEYRRQTQLTNPDYELFDDIAEARAEAEVTAKRPIPIYPATSSIPSTLVQKTISLVLDGLGEIEDPLPDDVRSRRGLLPARAAFEQIHRPENDDDILPAIATLRMHEAFVLQTALLQQRQFVRALVGDETPRCARRAPRTLRRDPAVRVDPGPAERRCAARSRPRRGLADEPSRAG
ncbi:RecG-like helicase [Microbacterium sp. SORGH_AS454]|nr:RecG-like helicase [Microbacterium sp. SORGH_AS_0454]